MLDLAAAVALTCGEVVVKICIRDTRVRGRTQQLWRRIRREEMAN